MSDWPVLLPAPQRLTRQEGSFRPAPGRLIWLMGPLDDDFLRAGRAVQEALEKLGDRWELTAAYLEGAQIGVTLRIDPGQVARPEGYALTIRPDQITLVGHDVAGAYYGAMTLRQLVRQAEGGSLPCLRIEDWPDFAHRGVMLDISRDRVPRIDTLTALIDQLAEWKVNQLQLYTEHTFAYRNHRTVWADASPLTGEEILLLDAYCRKRFIELVPNQNTFGHMARWLKHEAYQPLAEAPNGFAFPWGVWSDEPFSLCPTDPASLALVEELLDELLPHFTSRQVNVGCDETWDVGQPGTRSQAACDQKGSGQIYLDFLTQIYHRVQARGHTMQFWGDIILRHPDLIPALPKDAIAMEWGYEANHPFDADCAAFARAGVPFYVCPGTSSWNSIAGRTENALGNLWSAAENGLKHGAIGYLNTDWGDNGHWQPLPVSFLGFAYGAAVSWAARANKAIDLPRALDLHVFMDEAGVMGHLAYDLGNASQGQDQLHNSTALFHLLLSPDRSLADLHLHGLTVVTLSRAEDAIDAAVARLGEARMARLDADLVRDEFRLAANLLRHACRLGIARLEAPGQAVSAIPPQQRALLADDLDELIAEYNRLWQARSRPGGLVDSVGRLEKLRKLYAG